MKNKIFNNSEEPLILFLFMIINFFLLLTQINLISRIFLTKFRLSYYLVNGLLILIGMFNKIIGFEEAWERKSKLLLNTILILSGMIWLGYLFTLIEDVEC